MSDKTVGRILAFGRVLLNLGILLLFVTVMDKNPDRTLEPLYAVLIIVGAVVVTVFSALTLWTRRRGRSHEDEGKAG